MFRVRIEPVDVVVRPETSSDYPAIRHVNEAAFSGAAEAGIVEALRTEDAVLLSVVAESAGTVVGHILFSRMSIVTPSASIPAVALAPLAVRPSHQRQGIGGKLVRHGLSRLHEMGERIVIVVGHPAYYPRFGFSTALARSLQSPFKSEVFMALELSPGALTGVHGHVKYPAAFGL